MAQKVKMAVIRRRDAQEWMEDSNLLILKGRAMQCLTYQELADSIGINIKTLEGWRKKYPEIKDAIELGRNEADDAILAITFDQAAAGVENAADRWWRYRLGPKFAKVDTPGETDNGVLPAILAYLAKR